MNSVTTTPSDPDRYFNLRGAGSQEWWYFDAISADGRDAIVVVFYAGLPFDPAYGLAAERHLQSPAKHPAPNPLDHSAIGISWYRDGKTLAYALNRYPARCFSHNSDPFSVRVDASRLQRGPDGYRLSIDTPSVKGQDIHAEFYFDPKPGLEPFERNLGTDSSPHHWILAAPDCRVEGAIELAGSASPALTFRGRGYHDHNAGAEEIRRAMSRWAWGRVHIDDQTIVYYHAEPRHGPAAHLALRFRPGRPTEVVETDPLAFGPLARQAFGVRYPVTIDGPASLPFHTRPRHLVDDGPFYLRWVSDFQIPDKSTSVPGITELLDTKRLHSRWFNWMIPYRLKQPKS